ncbi:hypothetical protein HO133_002977 [Letharia lupina]|uniref:NAD(P)-binding protein n=1 Tax=Letharia lupina TaxID=560253 RepID=A0A8H6CBT2_9LECA|nr:uncharacterized protein HO133_002977 [Letharia lupina]KAF6220544.1 hypothetical protein HO133_002977 [Letharia lupina]
MPNIIVTGAASGLGKAFVTAYLKSADNSVLAVDRSFSSSSAQNVLEAADAYRKDVGNNETNTLRMFTIDVRDETQITTQLHDVEDIDLVIHSAGVRGLESSVSIKRSADVAEAETMNVITAETMTDTFQTNTVGTFLLIRALLPKLRPLGGSKVVIMGSRMGSMGSNTTGGGYAYRASKAALNAIVKSFSIDLPDIIFTVVHPGRVESGLVAVKEDGAISAEESVVDVLGLIGRFGNEDSGKFFDRFGEEVPW